MVWRFASHSQVKSYCVKQIKQTKKKPCTSQLSPFWGYLACIIVSSHIVHPAMPTWATQQTSKTCIEEQDHTTHTEWIQYIPYTGIHTAICSVLIDTHHKGNILDLILTNCSKIVHDVKVHSNISCIPTDHFIISSSLKVPNIPLSKTKSQFVYNYRQADFIQLADYLLNCNFEPCLTSYDLDLEYVWSFIKSTIHKAMDLFIPKVKLKQSNAPKWFNTTIRHIHHLRRQAKYRPSTSTQAWAIRAWTTRRYASYKSRVWIQIKSGICLFKNYKIYEYIKSLRKEDSLPSTMTNSTTTAIEDLEKATLFN